MKTVLNIKKVVLNVMTIVLTAIGLIKKKKSSK